MTFSPDDSKATHFLSQLYESSFRKDIAANRLAIGLRYSMLHCSSCEESGFTMAKDNCLSGGRYCMKSSRLKDLSGEVMLVQAIKNDCTETILENANRRSAIWEYYWTFHNNCQEEFRPECSNAILKKLGIKNEVFKCIHESFEQTAKVSKDTTTDDNSPKILLQDNSILRRHMTEFMHIEHYAHFPMIKINGMVFYGPAKFQDIFSFICMHVRDSLTGCDKFLIIKDAGKSTNRRFFELIALLIVGMIVAVAVLFCRNTLKRKFDGELAYKIDQSVNEFLKKTGGSDL